jgi:hypothetical protein
MFLLSSLFQRSHWRLSVGSLGFYVLDSVLKSVTGIELPKEVFTSRARWMPLIIEWNVFTNMFYILKNLLLLILVIFKLKCSNLIFNEIIVLNASYVCLYAFLLHWESPDPDPGRWPLISEVVLSHLSSSSPSPPMHETAHTNNADDQWEI